MRTPADIIALWPSIGAFAADIDVTAKHASQMKFRNSVPVTYWPRMVAAAAGRGIELSYEGLVGAHAQPGGFTPAQESATPMEAAR
ncbi:hypothetical protein [Ancylobacter sp.]|uniref:hypothetical protein n=1 Tax=Ancylobacter sp. TaxID=1872567 RepID=UPI003D11F29D